MFGAEDNFFTMFARLSRILPVLPLIGGGQTRFQPVYVMDVAKAVVQTLGDIRSCGHVFELGGTEILTFKQILERLFVYTGKARCLITLPWWVARVQAVVMAILPNPPLTNDQITSLQTDSVVSKESLGFRELGITPTAMDSVVPAYLGYMNYTPKKD
jgi:NADH dehydrogenase